MSARALALAVVGCVACGKAEKKRKPVPDARPAFWPRDCTTSTAGMKP